MEESSPYARGIEAGHRIGEYEGVIETPKCPYPEGSPENDQWYDGFGDGTEDYIAYQRSD